MMKSIITDNWKKDVPLSSHELGTEKKILSHLKESNLRSSDSAL